MNSELPSPMDANMVLPGDVGDVLRASRLRHGEELADVARALRIRIIDEPTFTSLAGKTEGRHGKH